MDQFNMFSMFMPPTSGNDFMQQWMAMMGGGGPALQQGSNNNGMGMLPMMPMNMGGHPMAMGFTQPEAQPHKVLQAQMALMQQTTQAAATPIPRPPPSAAAGSAAQLLEPPKPLQAQMAPMQQTTQAAATPIPRPPPSAAAGSAAQLLEPPKPLQAQMALMQQTTQAAATPIPRPPPPAAAGSAAQLLEPPQPLQVKKSVASDLEEEEDGNTASSNFASFMQKLKRRAETKKDVSNSDDSEADSDPPVKKRRGKMGVGRPKGQTNRAPLLQELRDIATNQFYEIEELVGEEKRLKEELKKLQFQMKKSRQEEGDSDVILISSDEDVKGLPMSFAWGKEDGKKKGRNSSMPKEGEDIYDWEAEEAAGTFRIPEDDYGFINDEDHDVSDTPFLHVESIIDKTGDIKHPCKSCKVEEAVFQIRECCHFGLCPDCSKMYKNVLTRCPGCGESHVIDVTSKVYF